MFGALYYRCLEKDKTLALKVAKGSFEAQYVLNWWLENLEASYNVLQHPSIDIVLYSDVSTIGWGAALGEQSRGGHWSPTEAELHINALELQAAFCALRSFKHSLSGKHVKLMIDNTSAVYINNMGTSHSDNCHSICVAIWEFCMTHKIWLTAAHLPGALNVVADNESRRSYSDSEWMIDSNILQNSLSDLYFTPEMDLFASRLNNQLNAYCSYRSDPDAMYINAFSISWANLLQVVQKIIQDKAEGVIVIPNWPTQAGYSLLQPLLVKVHRNANRQRHSYTFQHAQISCTLYTRDWNSTFVLCPGKILNIWHIMTFG
ncbi:Transposon Tf2-6 poly [Paramuricea clavata]|uniref:Transposon Tf2-6 poly n=1 Tax=Paramuricea clavata TaxID=317549 RepID=A0A7D9DJ01_PARCT|nr:Transposon Tf2-6 poly [Paramuricea clavata]